MVNRVGQRRVWHEQPMESVCDIREGPVYAGSGHPWSHKQHTGCHSRLPGGPDFANYGHFANFTISPTLYISPTSFSLFKLGEIENLAR